MPLTASRTEVLGLRVRAQQLDRAEGRLDDTAVLDLGVQDTGPDGARWALAVRGVDVDALAADDLVTLWTVRGAPHVYRRADLPQVLAATAPFSEADAAKRVHDAATPLRAAGVPVLAALDELAGHLRALVTAPTVKGDVSGQLSRRVGPEHVRDCVPCGTTHVWEMPFRLAALRAGLELRPGTSPPLLVPVPGLAPADEPGRCDVVRGLLHLLGPAAAAQVAAYLDAPVADVRARWPPDAVEVVADGQRRELLPADVGLLAPPPAVTRLLGPFDPYLQARDRGLLVPDPVHAKALFPALGRPGAVLVDGELAGTWRARRSRRLALTVQLWSSVGPDELQEQAERLAACRGVPLGPVEVTGP